MHAQDAAPRPCSLRSRPAARGWPWRTASAQRNRRPRQQRRSPCARGAWWRLTRHRMPPTQAQPGASRRLDGPCPAAVFGSVLPAAQFADLRAQYSRVVDSEYEPPDKADSLTYGAYWFSLRDEPRNAIEAAALTISRSAAFRAAVDVDAIAGVEWWFQVQGPEDCPKEYHTDKDVHIKRAAAGSAAADEIVEQNPAFSSVFYFDDIGGPTVAFGQRQHQEALSPSSPTQLMLAFPSPNQLFVFGGELFHGVLHPPPGSELRTHDRFTLPINWWRSRPYGPVDLPACFCFAELDQSGACAGPSDVVTAAAGSALGLAPEPEPEQRVRGQTPAWLGMELLNVTTHHVDVPFVTHQEHLSAWRSQHVPQELLELEETAHGGGRSPLRAIYAEQLPRQQGDVRVVAEWPG